MYLVQYADCSGKLYVWLTANKSSLQQPYEVAFLSSENKKKVVNNR